jgi:hypothetical protein
MLRLTCARQHPRISPAGERSARLASEPSRRAAGAPDDERSECPGTRGAAYLLSPTIDYIAAIEISEPAGAYQICMTCSVRRWSGWASPCTGSASTNLA